MASAGEAPGAGAAPAWRGVLLVPGASVLFVVGLLLLARWAQRFAFAVADALRLGLPHLCCLCGFACVSWGASDASAADRLGDVGPANGEACQELRAIEQSLPQLNCPDLFVEFAKAKRRAAALVRTAQGNRAAASANAAEEQRFLRAVWMEKMPLPRTCRALVASAIFDWPPTVRWALLLLQKSNLLDVLTAALWKLCAAAVAYRWAVGCCARGSGDCAGGASSPPCKSCLVGLLFLPAGRLLNWASPRNQYVARTTFVWLLLLLATALLCFSEDVRNLSSVASSFASLVGGAHPDNATDKPTCNFLPHLLAAVLGTYVIRKHCRRCMAIVTPRRT
eukprot:GHVT01077426.1.p1 GENE.GHVT01077426.1~~GHVT01077426.1.p1  ORF type:complete len:337 (+),score=73.38 GHVT01077426.1:173-1183(+)